MNIHILTVGKLKEKYLQQGIQEYVKRLGPYAKMTITEIPDEKAPDNLSDADVEEVKRIEGEQAPQQNYTGHLCDRARHSRQTANIRSARQTNGSTCHLRQK